MLLDWNGNRKTDPTDVGISMAAFEESTETHKAKKNKPGCLASVLALALAGISPMLIIYLV